MAKVKYVYYFGDGKAEGNSAMKELLGGKGANLAEMTNLGVPVPPGFTISTEVCESFYKNDRHYPAGMAEEVKATLKVLEKFMGKKLGDAKDPLLVSVRSGAAASMPGMMDTILNLGLNDTAVEGLTEITGNPRFAWDSYRRFIQMFSNVAKGMDINIFENILHSVKKAKNIVEDTDLNVADLKSIVQKYKAAYKKALKEDFPQDPVNQLFASIDAVFGSWNNGKAVKYRQLNDITGLKGTAVNVQSMVFGNFGEDSGTGVCFSRDPSTGKKIFYGEYLMNAQGEDVVSGIRTPQKIETLARKNPVVYKQLVELKDKLELHYRDMQDMEFTIQQGTLYILQTRNGKRTGAAAIKCAVDMVEEKLITKEQAITRVSADQLDQMFHPLIDLKVKKALTVLTKGLNASPGAATGRIVFTADDAEEWKRQGERVILVRQETSPEDIGGMAASTGIITATGGMTSHAAVVARGMGKPCIAGCQGLEISGKTLKIGDKRFKEGDWLSFDGTSGLIYEGEVPLVKPKFTADLEKFLGWADQIRATAERPRLEDKGFYIRTNADLPEDAKIGRKFGAEGIGLCRTEHMFFGEGKLEIFQEMIVAEDMGKRVKALGKLLPLQKKDFTGIFTVMNGLPVTIRLLDPPLHEFLPKTTKDIKHLADQLGITAKRLKDKIDSMHELNPMLGHRGCRLGITYPEIYNMQVEAIILAACEVAKKGVKVFPEIMIPLVGTREELEIIRNNAETVITDVFSRNKVKVNYKIGTMIEIPRAAITANEIAEHADFFSFGTNDLTQMTYGYSRDDIGSFVNDYIDKGILHHDPFQSLDISGVGHLIIIGLHLGRQTRKNLKAGICGEHGGDPRSIEFVYKTGLNGVSCSPYRVPIARLAAAQAVINNR